MSSVVEKEATCFKCIKSSNEIDRGRRNRLHYEKIFKGEESKTPVRDISIESIYEPMIKFKKSELEYSDKEMPYFEASSNAFNLALESGMKIIDKIHPDLVIIYSPQYAANSGFSKAAEVTRVPVMFMEGSSSPYNRYSAVRLWDWNKYGLSNPVATSEDYLTSRINFRSLSHFRIIRKGLTHSSYSIKKRGESIRSRYQIHSKCRIILAIVSSSDEVFSASAINKINKKRLSTSVFANQIDWIENTIKYVSELIDTILIIRIHPRDFPNKRDSITSMFADIWEKKSRESHRNVIWNLPSENVSLYDLLDSASVVVTGWSSVALEALNQKIPVVTYDKELCGFPESLTRTGNSREMYFSNLEQALEESHSWKLKVRVLKYISFRDFESTFRTGGIYYSSPLFSFFPYFGRIFSALCRNAPTKIQNYLNKSINRCRDKEKIWLWIQKQISEKRRFNEYY